MCGIYGMFNKRPSDETMDAMEHALRHRGPDGEGRLIRQHSGMGMTRLSIMDQKRGQQPFFSAERQVAAIMNGEIYNWKDLRRELHAKGYQFHTECDAEILPAAWQEWGTDMLGRLNGMFAIALLDGEKLFLARDPVGQKPLYIASGESGAWLFASEIAGIRAAGYPVLVDTAALPHWLALRYVPGPETLVKGVKHLPPGHFLTWEPDSPPEIRTWWQPPAFHRCNAPSDADAVSALADLVDSSTALALQSDRPISCYLSAGADSALLLDAIHRTSGTCQTLTVGFGAASDEVRHAARTAKRLGFPHHEIKLGAQCLERLPQVVRQMGTPVGDPLILAFDALASASAQLGCPVAIGGEGPDELFQGYSFQKSLRTAEALGPLGRKFAASALRLAPPALLDAGNALPVPLGKSGKRKIIDWLGTYSRASDWEKGIGLRTLFTPAEISRLLLQNHWEEPALANGENLSDRHHRHQFSEWLPDWSIIRQDRNAMAHSVEYRMPFLDPRLIKFSGTLGRYQKIRRNTGKWLWRELAKNRLPPADAQRPKQPFYFPLETFARLPVWKNLVGDLLSPEAIHSQGIFQIGFIEALKNRAENPEFLPLKQLMALVIFQLWHSQLEST